MAIWICRSPQHAYLEGFILGFVDVGPEQPSIQKDMCKLSLYMYEVDKRAQYRVPPT